jgi:hypothetical protein
VAPALRPRQKLWRDRPAAAAPGAAMTEAAVIEAASTDGPAEPGYGATMLARIATVGAQEQALREQRAALEALMLARPAASWAEAGVKVRYLLGLLAGTAIGRDPQRRRIIKSLLADLERLEAAG